LADLVKAIWAIRKTLGGGYADVFVFSHLIGG